MSFNPRQRRKAPVLPLLETGHSLWLRSSTEARRGDRDFLTDNRYFEVVLD